MATSQGTGLWFLGLVAAAVFVGVMFTENSDAPRPSGLPAPAPAPAPAANTRWEDSEWADGNYGQACIRVKDVLREEADTSVNPKELHGKLALILAEFRRTGDTSISNFSVAFDVLLEKLDAGQPADKEIARLYSECSGIMGRHIKEKPPELQWK